MKFITCAIFRVQRCTSRREGRTGKDNFPLLIKQYCVLSTFIRPASESSVCRGGLLYPQDTVKVHGGFAFELKLLLSCDSASLHYNNCYFRVSGVRGR